MCGSDRAVRCLPRPAQYIFLQNFGACVTEEVSDTERAFAAINSAEIHLYRNHWAISRLGMGEVGVEVGEETLSLKIIINPVSQYFSDDSAS